MEPGLRIELTTTDYEVTMYLKNVWSTDRKNADLFFKELTKLKNIKDVKLFVYKQPCFPVDHFIKRDF